jgi:TRAP-type C4-dicarboxylate transport system substrate-binding protein
MATFSYVRRFLNRGFMVEDSAEYSFHITRIRRLQSSQSVRVIIALAAATGVCLNAVHAWAEQFQVAVPEYALNDRLVTSLKTSASLEKQGIRISIVSFSDSLQVIGALKSGEALIGLFTLDALLQVEQKNSGFVVAPILTRPFQFQSDSELTSVLDTTLGDSILADVGRAKFVPLAFWNRGLSLIASSKAIRSPLNFADLKVASFSFDSVSVLTALGAQSSLIGEGERPAAVMAATHVDAIEVPAEDFLHGLNARAVIYGFRPLIGTLAANFDRWNSLSEAQKQALASAASEASEQANALILHHDQNITRRALEQNVGVRKYDDAQLNKLK